MAWYGIIWHGMAWYGMVWHGMPWYGMAWHGMTWYDMVWCEACEGCEGCECVGVACFKHLRKELVHELTAHDRASSPHDRADHCHDLAPQGLRPCTTGVTTVHHRGQDRGSAS